MKAMILAAGRGERLRPLTDHLPKPLLAVAGQPLIEYHLQALAQAGFQEVLINHAWLGHLLEQRLGDGSRFGLNISYSAEGATGLETAGGIKHALAFFADAPFLVINGDIFTDYPLSCLPQQLAPQIMAHLILVPNPAHHLGGDFGLQPATNLLLAQAPEQFTFSGIGLYRPEFFSQVAPGPQRLAPYLRAAMAQQQVTGELYSGLWLDIGTEQRLAQAEQIQQSKNRAAPHVG